MLLDYIRIVLVNPSHPGNIGATARAMKNMGLKNLYLVAPQREINHEAIARAAGADDILYHAKHCQTLPEAIADCQVVFGTSARISSEHVRHFTPKQLADTILESFAKQNCAIVFGREHAGLNNDELRLCQYHIQIPCDEEFSSLNLGAAVQVICYELFCALQDIAKEKPHISSDEVLASQEELQNFYSHLEQTLIDIEFLDPAKPRKAMVKLQRLFQRNLLSSNEVQLLRGILTASQKKKMA